MVNLLEEMPETVNEFLDDLNRGYDFEPNRIRLHLLGAMENCARCGREGEFVDDDAP